MKITVETGGEPNPQLEAFKAFVLRNKKRLIIAGAAIVALVIALFVAVQLVGAFSEMSDAAKVQACVDEYKLPPAADDFHERDVCIQKVKNGVYP